MAFAVRPGGATEGSALPSDRRWWALAAVTLAQLMVVLDLTVVNLALPLMQADLGLADHDRQWVITVYALAFGSLLLLGGRVSDLIGRRRALLIALTGFAGASAIGAVATDLPMMLVSRGLQGVFGALMVPSITALVVTLFPAPAERARAFGVVGMIIGAGAGIGLILGGVLTETLGWRSAFTFNLPVALVAGVGILLTVRPMPRNASARIDVRGAILITGALASLVFGASRAELDGWLAMSTVGPLLLGVGLAIAFVGAQRDSATPLLPLGLLADRRRVLAIVAGLAVGLTSIPALVSLALWFQAVRGASPLEAGFALLPQALAIIVLARVVGRVMPRVAPVWLLGGGLVAMTLAITLLSQTDAGSPYLMLLPVLLLLGAGTAMIMPTANATVTQDAGPNTAVAGALVMTSMQTGIAFGAAIFGTIAASSAADYAAGHAATADLAAEATAFGIAQSATVSAVVVGAMALTIFAIGARRRRPVTLPVLEPVAVAPSSGD